MTSLEGEVPARIHYYYCKDASGKQNHGRAISSSIIASICIAVAHSFLDVTTLRLNTIVATFNPQYLSVISDYRPGKSYNNLVSVRWTMQLRHAKHTLFIVLTLLRNGLKVFEQMYKLLCHTLHCA